ncbi:MAG: amidohydrolase family protein [Desulfurococcaceae archaeon TW002]
MQSSRYKTPIKLQPREVLKMSTEKTAKSLGIEDLVGVLEPRKKADIIVLKPPKTRLVGLYDNPYTTIIYNLGDESVSYMYVDGRKIISDRALSGIDMENFINNS